MGLSAEPKRCRKLTPPSRARGPAPGTWTVRPQRLLDDAQKDMQHRVHLGRFALFGEEQRKVYLPLVVQRD